ncbi:hypothetical protein ABKN59_003117 [Abortiporus biennis]
MSFTNIKKARTALFPRKFLPCYGIGRYEVHADGEWYFAVLFPSMVQHHIISTLLTPKTLYCNNHSNTLNMWLQKSTFGDSPASIPGQTMQNHPHQAPLFLSQQIYDQGKTVMKLEHGVKPPR